MNRGYRLTIHKSIPHADRERLLKYLDGTIEWFNSSESYKCRKESDAYLRRGKLGIVVDKEEKYVFRRLVKGRRIFGIMPVSLLERKDGEPINMNQCMCAIHRGGQMVNIVGGFSEDDFETIYETGLIKG